eukprot:TRINITY_DN15813_c0_g3_i1.p1 TRINITY_DN15813_c0_g3~~TRINITY_DN15813_c0_g3_i1.p1  ORF type:complete len:1367 (+),score=393.26 TRINITY_DN15813_c0_g3_i1:92-4192(+)
MPTESSGAHLRAHRISARAPLLTVLLAAIAARQADCDPVGLRLPLPPLPRAPPEANGPESRDQGTCCYVCSSPRCDGYCLGCWEPSSFCSDTEEVCQATCGGTWCAKGKSPYIPPRPPPAPALLPEPALRWRRMGGELPAGMPTVVGDSVFLSPGNITFTDGLQGSRIGSVHRARLSDGVSLWSSHLEELFEVNASFLHQLYRPVYASGFAYVQVDNFLTGPSLFALDVTNGAVAWNVTIEQRLMPTDITAGEDGVFYVTRSGDLVARFAENGTVRWVHNFGGDFSSPTHLNNVVFKSGESDKQRYIFAIGARSGSELWATPSCTDVTCGTVSPWGQRVAASGDLVFIATTFFKSATSLPVGQPDGRLQAHSASSGRPKWGIDIAGAISQPVISSDPADGTVFFTSCSRQPQHTIPVPPHWWIGCSVWALDMAEDHENPWDAVRWHYRLPPDQAVGLPKVADGVIFLSASRFVNGTLPFETFPSCNWHHNTLNCTFPTNDPFWQNCTLGQGWPNCTWTPEQLGNSSLPGYVDPYLFALRASDGALMWQRTLENSTAPNATETAARWPDTWATLTLVYRAVNGDAAARRQLEQESLSSTVMDAWFGAFGISTDWSPSPWQAFAVDDAGKNLVYSSFRGVYSLDVSARADDDSLADAWVWPVAMSAAGLSLAVLLALCALRCFAAAPGYQKLPHHADGGSDASSETQGEGEDPHAVNAESPTGGEGRYIFLSQLGRGGFGTVFLVRRDDTRELFSLKRIECRNARDLRVARHEVRMLRELPQHKGLINVVDNFTSGGAVFIVMPYFEQGDLAKYIIDHGEPAIPEPTVVSFVRQLAKVLGHLHGLTPAVAHRDLKPENILISSDRKHIVVTDFGLARLVEKTYMHTHAGTMAFMAPEAFGGPYDTKVDIWSVGCIIYAMATRRVRNCKVMCVHVGRKGFYQEIAQTIAGEGYSPLVVDLVRQMLQVNRHARPSAEEVLFRLGGDAPPPLRLGEQALGEAQTPPTPSALPPPAVAVQLAQPPPTRAAAAQPQPPPPGRPLQQEAAEAPIAQAVRDGVSVCSSAALSPPAPPTAASRPPSAPPTAAPAAAQPLRLPAALVPAPAVAAPSICAPPAAPAAGAAVPGSSIAPAAATPLPSPPAAATAAAPAPSLLPPGAALECRPSGPPNPPAPAGAPPPAGLLRAMPRSSVPTQRPHRVKDASGGDGAQRGASCTTYHTGAADEDWDCSDAPRSVHPSPPAAARAAGAAPPPTRSPSQGTGPVPRGLPAPTPLSAAPPPAAPQGAPVAALQTPSHGPLPPGLLRGIVPCGCPADDAESVLSSSVASDCFAAPQVPRPTVALRPSPPNAAAGLPPPFAVGVLRGMCGSGAQP